MSYSYADTCPSCGSAEGTPGLAHGAPGDRSLAGLLCSVAQVRRLLTGDDPDLFGEVVTPEDAADLLDGALARFAGVGE